MKISGFRLSLISSVRISGLSRYALSSCAAAALLAGCGGGNFSVPAASADVAAFAHHETFKYTGSVQTFAVPKGVKQIEVDALGGNGGSFETGGFRTGPGGYGGRVVTTLNVTPQEQLLVYVGGSGSTGGFNGGAAGGAGIVSDEEIDGAGGGGASDVRTDSALNDRIVVAGGGGGGGGIYTKRLGSNFGAKGSGPIGGAVAAVPSAVPTASAGAVAAVVRKAPVELAARGEVVGANTTLNSAVPTVP
jgi:hypothetical protein